MVRPVRGGRQVSRLGSTFADCRAENRAALVGYLPAGYPDLVGSIAACTAMVESGCDIIEVGIAYSDPVMDGPTIQAAAEQALRGGVRVRDVFSVVEAISNSGGKAVVMTYWNPVLQYGVDRFARDLATAGDWGSSPRTSSPKRPVSGSPPPRNTISTASSWSRRPRPRSGSSRPSKPAAASCTPPPPWASPAPVTPYPRPPPPCAPASAPIPTSRSASASASAAAPRPPRSPPTPTA